MVRRVTVRQVGAGRGMAGKVRRVQVRWGKARRGGDGPGKARQAWNF